MSLMDDPDAVRRLRSAAHPLRLRIMSLLTGAELSTSEIARELGITQANASYHVRVLERSGQIQLTGTEKVRGGVAKKYRYGDHSGGAGVGRDPAVGPGGPTANSAELVGEIAALSSELQRRAPRAVPVDDLPGHLFVDLETHLEPDVWREVVDLITRASRLAHERAQPATTPGSVGINLSVVLFTTGVHDTGEEQE